jgi:predicted permease
VLSQLSAVVLPVVIIAGIGYAWARLSRPFDNALVTQLVSLIGSPCLVAGSLTSLHVQPESLGMMALATILVFSGMFVLGFAVLKVMGLPMHSYLPAIVFSNAGNMGLPLALFAFGDSGLALAVVYFAFSATLQFTAGVSLAGLTVRSLPRNLFLSLVRMIGGFALSVLVAWALDLPPMARGVLLIQASMPVAVFNYLFAQYYQRRPEDVAAMVIISTLLSFGTLPFLIYYVLSAAQ